MSTSAGTRDGVGGARADVAATRGGVAAPVADAVTRIRLATPGDAPSIRALDGLSASTLRLLDHDLGLPDRHCLVATVGTDDASPTSTDAAADTPADASPAADDTDGRLVVGYAAAILQHTDAHVIDIAVAPTCRRQGIARKLLDALVAGVCADGADAVTLEVRASNLGPRALYRQAGFVDEGRRPRYYPDGEDALIWWLRSDRANHDDAEEVD